MATTVDANTDNESKRRTVQGEIITPSVSSLRRNGVRDAALGRDSRAETKVGVSSDLGTSGSLLGCAPGEHEGLHNRVSESVGQRWMSFGGIKAAQILADYWLWEAILNGAKEETTGIVELGTGKGGFSLYLAAQARARGLSFRTYDVAPPDCSVPGFIQLDIYAHIDEIGQFLGDHDPLILFCDGGNKPRELREFSQCLSPDSLIVVHDWGTEMLESDVPDNVQEAYGGLCDELGSMSRCFTVKS